jgi:hypothetical protein
MIARLLLSLALLAATPAAAQPAAGQTLAGSWALQMDGTTIFRFDLSKDADGHWQGTWSKPGSFASDGNHFQKLSGPLKHEPSMTAIDLPNDGAELSFDDPRPGAVPDIFDFEMIDANAVKMTYVGTGLAPYTLVRVAPDAPLGPWDPAKTYSREVETKKSEDSPDKLIIAPPIPVDSGQAAIPAGAPTGR